MSIHEQDDTLHCLWEYATDLFERESIERMSRHYHALLEAIARDTGTVDGGGVPFVYDIPSTGTGRWAEGSWGQIVSCPA